MKLLGVLRYWAGGIRLYIALGVVLLSLQAWWWTSLVFGGNPDLAVSRLHETYGWLSLVFLAITMAIGPIYKLVPGLPGKALMRDARRMLGIAAAWFAGLHTAIAYGVSLKGINPFELTTDYKQAFLLGTVALLILAALTLTSFNAAMRSMGKWWFRLHRLVYVAAGVAVLHALVIGIHATSLPALLTVSGVTLVLLIMHISVALQQERRPGVLHIAALCLVFVALVAASNYGIQQYIDRNTIQGHNH